MGIGRFDDGTHKFSLLVSMQYPASVADQDQWKKAFQRASELLYNATDGKHQLGTIHVSLNSMGGASADVWIMGTTGTSESGGYAALGSAGVHVTTNYDERLKPLVIVHELGHHIYGLRDEYTGAGGAAGGRCLGHTGSTPNANACIMEANQTDGDQFNAATGLWTPGTITEFCSADHTATNEQDSVNHESCWATMATGAALAGGMSSREYPDLSPVPATPMAGPAPGPDLINWVVLDSTQRFVLVIDRSGSMMGDKLTEAKFGADWWADAVNQGDRVAVVSFSDTVTPDVLHTINTTADRDALHTWIALITAGGMTSIGGGLRAAFDILNDGPRTITESIVLLTDGRQNSGEHPSTVLPDLIARGVRVFTIGIGSDVDPILLNDIATATGGTYYVA